MDPSSKHAPATSSGLPAPQYSLRTLMLATTGCAVLLAATIRLSAVWSAGLTLLVLLIGAHVAGNALGSRLRRLSPTRSPWQRDSGSPEKGPHDQPPFDSRSVGAARVTRLRERSSPSRKMTVVTGVGAVLGGALGGTGFVLAPGDSTTWIGVVVGSLSAAVLGGFLGFMVSSFLEIFGGALGEALHDPNRPGA